MFEPNSRYASLQVKTLEVAGPDGELRQVRYVERRFIPPPGNAPTLVEHQVAQGERLDQVTAKYLGDPTQFWRVADANEVLRPEELTETPGRRLRVTLPH
jgi:hypothetical protein